MGSVRVGTMGWGYSDWVGPFYPEDAAAKDYIALYSRAFHTVEIDSTFYGTPRETQVKGWAKSTPEGFVFCPKAPRLITHDLRLEGAEVEIRRFVEVMSLLGPKLGPMLLQFPPSFTRADLPRLQAFLPLLRELTVRSNPKSDTPMARFAMEFRHRSLVGADVSALLAEHGIALAATHYPAMPQRLEVTADLIYLRLIGQHGAYPHHRELQGDRSADLERWMAALRSNLGRVQAAYIQCNDDYEGFAPGTAEKCCRLLGLPMPVRPQAVQGSLF
jgi:uncharacterized protein YecE (DUF72 family)